MRTKLTDTAIRNAKPGAKPLKLTDGGGLYLEVRPSGAKLWRYRYRIDGKENVFAAGEYIEPQKSEDDARAGMRQHAGKLTLMEARARRIQWASQVKQGLHPARERKLEAIRAAKDRTNTLSVLAEEWVDSRDWEPDTKDGWRRMLRLHVLPVLGDVPVKMIESAHVLSVLKSIEAKAPATAAQARRALTGIYELAIATLRADKDPVWPVRKAIKAPKANHKKALDTADIGRLLRLMEDSSANLVTKIAFRMLWYTLARPNEVLGSRWSEIDLDAALWRIPAERMKMREPHIVPLPTQAVRLLTKLRVLTGERTLLFPNRDDPTKPLSDNTLRMLSRQVGFASIYSPHATRATGSTLLNEMGFRSEAIEKQLAHGERNSVRRSYNRAIYLDERRTMMQQWADLLDALESGANWSAMRHTTVATATALSHAAEDRPTV